MQQKDIIIFSTGDWDNPFWTNKQHMATLFAKRGYRVLFVDSLGLRKPTAKKSDLWRIIKRLAKAFPLPRRVYPNIWRISPLALPFHTSAWAKKLNHVLLKALLSWCTFYLKMHKPILWTYNPLLADICKTLPHSGIVYHCVDDLSAAPRIDTQLILQGEQALASVAHMCFTTSLPLYERMKSLFPQTYYEPNVCDYAFFSTTKYLSVMPKDIQHIPEPRLLFIGALSDYKVNFSLIKNLAEKNPQWQWILIGAQGEGQPDSTPPPQMPNIHILGQRSYGQLPYYMKQCQVAVLPITPNAYTNSMFPMKFFEYLAAELPVVGTRTPSLQEFEHLYFSCDTQDDFQNNITQCLEGARKDATLVEQACQYNSWEARFARIESLLYKTLFFSKD